MWNTFNRNWLTTFDPKFFDAKCNNKGKPRLICFNSINIRLIRLNCTCDPCSIEVATQPIANVAFWNSFCVWHSEFSLILPCTSIHGNLIKMVKRYDWISSNALKNQKEPQIVYWNLRTFDCNTTSSKWILYISCYCGSIATAAFSTVNAIISKLVELMCE